MLYPTPSRDELVTRFRGARLASLPTPSAVLDRSVVARNCTRLAAALAGVRLRPHTKTHKTLEVTRLQLAGLGHGDVIVSTVREAEALEPLVHAGVVSGILYGMPLAPSAVPRLGALRARHHPALDLSVVLDHPDQLAALASTATTAGGAWNVFVKIDAGYRRAGLETASPELAALLAAIATPGTHTRLRGFYVHAGHSYASTSAACARAFLADEIAAVFAAADTLPHPPDGLILSVGATPTVLAAAATTAATDTAAATAADDGDGRLVRDAAQTAQQRGWTLELHAGVYTLMDLQQLSTAPAGGLGWRDMALTVLAEVVSVYPARREALVALGSTGLGREPGRIAGWGVVAAWRPGLPWDGAQKSGWRVDRISQEHGVLTHDDDDGGGGSGGDEPMELQVGMKLRVWPQHACIAGHAHGWYFVVDGDDCVVDIWVRCRGW